jgi:hypothetical protein
VVTYRRRCDACGYVPLVTPITVSILPGGTVAHGTHHAESFVCSFCENLQRVQVQG